MKKVVFKIDKKGNVTIEEISGYGSSCKSLTELLEKSLGTPEESSRTYTGEFYCDKQTTDENDLHAS